MDSLLANYASSSDDDGDEGEKEPSSSSSSLLKPSLFSSLPPPKIPASSSSSSSSLSSSLPAPKSKQIDGNQSIEPKQTKPAFSSLPPPKSSSSSSSSLCSSLPSPRSQQIEEKQLLESKQQRPIFSVLPPPKSRPSSDPNPKRVVQFTLPLNPSLLKPGDFDGDDEEEDGGRKPPKESSNRPPAPKGLSSMLPAPKNSLCLAPTAASRRSTFDSDASLPSKVESVEARQESSNLDGNGSSKAESFDDGGRQQQEGRNFEGYVSYASEEGAGDYENYGNFDGDWAGDGSMDASYASSYESYQSGGGYENYGSYGGTWSDTNVTAAAAPLVPEMERIVGKRGRNEIPAEIVEVNQAELMKNRPREDQVKVTGIAFGPAYQPVSSGKGKPSKLHKRKHQIGSLYYDMKQKEMELAERRAKGFLTKAETQAKYGW